ncbi:HlyC/CorC family transporter [Candidatus Nomurabacteria bacterium CG10_big_fil_rev_8_21_14_0_10_35_16]|uniref:HlyC/CorC family transporter n=1 Tax=Candidatus Nomurabacteria bacterium CG10_big_fil_rev_8_21_14_0_10_35_16 TaxID=1974731 RepID=A0A2H0TBS8_9BACT|nr:MAG: HlyC/CorC family transporter [Candidatus Nomurabacteria bacterium CG10_big_fil_rev_8_21_14_0_10_35_16]
MEDLIGLIFIIILGSALFSGLEAAFFAIPMSRAKIFKEQNKKGSESLIKIKEEMSRFITVIVILNNVVNIVGSIFVGVLVTNLFGSTWIGIISATMTFLIIVFGEILPKNIGTHYADKITLFTAGPLLIFIKIFYPVIWILEGMTEKFTVKNRIVSEEELQILSHLGHLEGSIEKDERDMIQRVFTLNDLSAREIMTPRTVISALKSESVIGEIEEDIYNLVNSRLPVYLDNIDNIIGVCHRRDLLIALGRDKKDSKVKDFVKPVISVSENAKADDLLPLFQKERNHLAVVKDEFGGTSGIVTLEDILEQLVGEIVDETDIFIDTRKRAKEKLNNNNNPA